MVVHVIEVSHIYQVTMLAQHVFLFIGMEIFEQKKKKQPEAQVYISNRKRFYLWL